MALFIEISAHSFGVFAIRLLLNNLLGSDVLRDKLHQALLSIESTSGLEL